MNIYMIFLQNPIFAEIYRSDSDQYLHSDNVTNFKKAIKISRIENILFSFKLFYVGCSRAKKELTIFIDSELISKHSKVKNKLESIGFDVLAN